MALVTGGTRGIGRAIAERLRDAGHQVLVTGTTATADRPSGCDYHGVDFLDQQALHEFAKLIEQRRPHILVNNAGVTKAQNFADIDAHEFERVQRVNLFAPQLLCRAVLPGMRAAGWGRIVNIGSMWGVVSKTGRATYSASKGGLDAMTMALAAEVAKDGILANCVAPGFVETDLLRAVVDEAGREQLASQVPLGRLAQPEEIAAFVAWLCSDENSYISGQTLVIDGGYTRV